MALGVRLALKTEGYFGRKGLPASNIRLVLKSEESFKMEFLGVRRNFLSLYVTLVLNPEESQKKASRERENSKKKDFIALDITLAQEMTS